MRKFENIEVRAAMMKAGVEFKDVAEFWGVNKRSFSRLMQKPLSDRKRLEVLAAVKKLSGNGND